MEKQLENLRNYLSNKKPENRHNGRDTKFLAIASGKGGVGKTNFSVNFAYILANHFGKRVLLIDADIGLGNVHVLLRLPLVKSLKDVLEGKRIEDSIVNIKNFDVLLGFSGFEKFKEIEPVKIDKLIQDIEKVSRKYDYVLIDTSAGIGDEVVSFILPSDKTFLITTPEPTAITDAYALIKTMVKVYNYSKFDVVINMCKNTEEGKETFEKLYTSSKRFLDTQVNLAGFLSLSENIRRAVIERKIIVEDSPKDSYSRSLIELVGRQVNESGYREDSSFWDKFISFFKRK